MKKKSEIHIGKNIQFIRHILGVKQTALSSKLKISQQTLSKIETQQKIDTESLVKIANALEISIDLIRKIDKDVVIDSINKNSCNDTKSIGEKIEGVRRFLCVTQTELGSSLGMTKQAISKMERAKKLSDNTITQVAKVLGVTKKGIESFNQEAIQYSLYISTLSKSKAESHKFSNILRLEKSINFFLYLLKKEKEKVHPKK